MTSEETGSTSFVETAHSRPWTATAHLGAQIVRELGFADGVDTLGRWMAHRVAELMRRAEELDDGPAREAARRDCSDLIMRLWAHRSERDHGRPLAEVAVFLDEFTNAPRRTRAAPDGAEATSWLGVLHRVVQLAEREESVCRTAAIADLSLEQDREWLAEQGDELSDDERKIIVHLVQAQAQTHSNYFRLDDTEIPDFGSLPPEERTTRALEQLQKIDQERHQFLEELRSKVALNEIGPAEPTETD